MFPPHLPVESPRSLLKVNFIRFLLTDFLIVNIQLEIVRNNRKCKAMWMLKPNAVQMKGDKPNEDFIMHHFVFQIPDKVLVVRINRGG